MQSFKGIAVTLHIQFGDIVTTSKITPLITCLIKFSSIVIYSMKIFMIFNFWGIFGLEQHTGSYNFRNISPDKISNILKILHSVRILLVFHTIIIQQGRRKKIRLLVFYKKTNKAMKKILATIHEAHFMIGVGCSKMSSFPTLIFSV